MDMEVDEDNFGLAAGISEQPAHPYLLNPVPVIVRQRECR